MASFVLTAQLQLQAPNNVAQIVSQIQSQLNNVNVNVNVQGSVQAQRQIQQITQSTNAASSAAERMGRTFAVSIRRFAAFSIATRAVGLFTSTLSSAIQTAIDFERQLIKVAQVTGRDISSLRDLTNEITNLSTNLGVSSQSLLEVTTILTQAGLTADDTKIALNSLARAALAPNFDSITQTAEGAIAILAQFKQGVGALEGQLGSINAVAGAFAVEASDLIDVIRRSGGVFKSSGGSLNELLALFTSVRATTRESAESIGTGLRTIFTRIQRPETIEFLKQFGVELVDLEGKFVGPYEAVRRLSGALAGLGERDITFIKIAEELGGFRQIGKVLPLLQQFATAEAALNVATNANNSLSKDAVTAQAALAIRIMKVKEEFLALIRAVTETPTFQIMANTALTLASALIKIADAIKPLLPLLAAVAAFRAIKGFGGFIGGITGGMKSGRTYHDGGKVHHFATGGLVPGVGNGDTVPARLAPGEFVIRKSSVQKIGAHNLARMNGGGEVQRFAGGGLIDKIATGNKEVGAALLENKGVVPGSFSVLKPEIEKRSGLKLNNKFPILGQFNAPREGLSATTSKTFNSALDDAIVGAANQTALAVANDLGLPPKQISSNTRQEFLNSINTGTRGNLFEDTLSVLKGGPFAQEPGRPFDFPNGLSGVLKDDYKNLPSSFIDAKASLSAAALTGKGSLQEKTIRQIVDELRSPDNLSLYTDNKGIQKGKESIVRGRTYTLSDLKKLDPTIRGEEDALKRFISPFKGKYQLRNLGGIIEHFAIGGLAKQKDTLQKYFEDSSSINLGLSNSRALGKEQRRQLASDVKDLRKLRTPAPVELHSALTRNAFDIFARDVGLNKNAPPGAKSADMNRFFAGEVSRIVGRSFKLPGFVSTSKNFAMAKSFLDNAPRSKDNWAAMLGITTKRNAQGVDTVEQLKGRNTNVTKQAINPRTGKMETMFMKQPNQENEFILSPRSRFRVKSANYRDMMGRHNVWADVEQFAAGGHTGTDTVPALLTPGEFVVNRKSAQRIGYGRLNTMNKFGRYANGGVVVQKFAAGTGTAGVTPPPTIPPTPTGSASSNPIKIPLVPKSLRTPLADIENQIRKEREALLTLNKSDMKAELKANIDTLKRNNKVELDYAKASGRTKKEILEIEKRQKEEIENVRKAAKSEYQALAKSRRDPALIREKAETRLISGLDPSVAADRKKIQSFAGYKARQGMNTLDTNTELGRKVYASTSPAQQSKLKSLQAEAIASQKAAAADTKEAASSDKAAKADAAEAANSAKASASSQQAANTNKLFAASMAVSLIQGFLPAIDENSSAIAKVTTNLVSLAVTLTSVGFALEAFGVNLTAGAVGSLLTGGGGKMGGLAPSIATKAGIAVKTGAQGIGFGASSSAVIGTATSGLVAFAGAIAGAVVAVKVIGAIADGIFDYDSKLKKAIKSGDIESAGKIATQKTEYENTKTALSGAAIGAAAGAFLGPIGIAIGASAGFFIGAAFQDSTDAAQTYAKAQAQATITQKAMNEAQKEATKAMEDFQNGNISAADALKQITSKGGNEAFNLERKNAEAIFASSKDVSSGYGAIARNVFTLGGLLGENASTRNARINKQNQEMGKAGTDVIKADYETQKDPIKEIIRQGIISGLNTEQINQQITEAGGKTAQVYNESAKSREADANTYAAQAAKARAEGDETLADSLQQSADTAREQAAQFRSYGEERIKIEQNLRKEIELNIKAFQALNLGLSSVIGAANASSLKVTNFVNSLEAGRSPMEESLSVLEASVTSAAQGISDSDFGSALSNASEVLYEFGASGEQVAKFQQNVSAVNNAQKNSAKIFEDVKTSLSATGTQSADVRKKGVIDSILKNSGLTEGSQEFNNFKNALNNAKIDLDKLAQGDITVFEEALKDLGENAIKQAKDAFLSQIQINKQLVILTKQRIEAERNLLEAQKEALSLTLEGRELQSKYGGKTLTTEERRQNILARANTNNLGLTDMRSGNLTELRNRNVELLSKFSDIEAKRRQGGLVGPEGAKLDEQQKDLKKAQKDQINTIRELVKLEEDNLKLIGEKNKLEKDSIDALIAGDIDKFMQTQAAVGATAAISTGNTTLMNAFGAEALGMAAQDIRRQQEAGVESLYGRKLAGQGGLTQSAFGAALSARGVTDPRYAQVAAGTTAEEEASKSRLRDLGSALGLAGEAGQAMANIELQTADMNVEKVTLYANSGVEVVQERRNAIAKANGGLIYANRGMFIPRGTDTVPAMLTPGEFVVRREAVNRGNNLQLLQQMNGTGGGMTSDSTVMGFAKGGRVQYYSAGSSSPVQQQSSSSINGNNFINELSKQIDRLEGVIVQHRVGDTAVNVNVMGAETLKQIAGNIEQNVRNSVAEQLSNAYPTDFGMRSQGTVLG